MRVLLSSHGSTGDIYPVIALGRALLGAGHSVRFATMPLFREEIEYAGLEFLYLPPDWGQEELADQMRLLTRARHPLAQLKAIYRGGLPFAGELIERMDAALAESDLLVTTYIAPYYKFLAQRYDVPTALLGFCHCLAPNPESPPYPMKKIRWLPRSLNEAWNQFWWKTASLAVDLSMNHLMRKTLRENSIPKFKNFLLGPADLVLVTVSPKLMKTSERIPSKFQFSGYLRWQTEEDSQLEKQLSDFCQGEEVPVLTFGSVTTDRDAENMRQFINNWPRDKKIILQSGWANFSSPQDCSHILNVGKVSHDQLFRHASCIVHHGGAGTTASALHSGKPAIVVPHIADQPFWAGEVVRLGTGTIVNKKHWPGTLPAAIEKVENNVAMRRRAEEVAKILKLEDGPATAVKALEEFYQIYQKAVNARP